MAEGPVLRSAAQQRQAAAAEDVFGLFERTVAEYEDRVCRSQEENRRQQKLLDAVFNCQLVLHREGIQQVIVGEQVPSQQQEGGPSLDQRDPKTPQIKEEEEELWTSEEIPPVSVKSEEDEVRAEEETASGSAEQMDCGGSEPATSLRVLVKRRLTEAVEDILKLFETTLAEYEEEIYHLHTLLEHVDPGIQTNRADDRKRSRQRDKPRSTPVFKVTATDTQKTVDVPGMDPVDRLAEYLVGLRYETGQTLTNQQVGTIAALWQDLLPHDQLRAAYAARHQVPLPTGSFSPKNKDEFTAGVENVPRLTGSSAQGPGCCRLVESIFVKLCNVYKSPQKQHSDSPTRWTLILREYSEIMQLVLTNAVSQNTTLQLFAVNHTTQIQWHNKRLRRQDCSVPLQGVNLPASTPVAPVPLPPVQVRPTAAPPQSGPQHQYHLPQSTAGQAVVKRKSAAPPHPHAPPTVRPRPTAQRQLIPKQAPPPACVPVVLSPSPAVGPFVFVTRRVPAATPIAPAGPLPRRPTVRRTYNRTVDKNKCKLCDQPRNKETGHSQYYGSIYCPQNSGMPLEQWMEEMRRKKADKKHCRLMSLSLLVS